MRGSIVAINSVDSFIFASIRAEDYTFPANVSSHPTVDRETVVDNAEYSPTEIEITARIISQPLREGWDLRLPPTGTERLTAAVERFEDFKGVQVQWFSPRFGPSDIGIIAGSSYSLVKESHVDFSFTLQTIEVAQQREVELPPEVVEPPSGKPEVDAGEQATLGPTKARAEEEGELSSVGYQGLRGARKSTGGDVLGAVN